MRLTRSRSAALRVTGRVPAAQMPLRAVFDGLAVSDWMAGGKAPPGFEDAWRDAVLQRQANFWKAVTELGRAELAPWRHCHGRLGYQVEVPIDGLAAPLW